MSSLIKRESFFNKSSGRIHKMHMLYNLYIIFSKTSGISEITNAMAVRSPCAYMKALSKLVASRRIPHVLVN